MYILKPPPYSFLCFFLSLFKSSFSPFLSSPILPPFSAGAHDTRNSQILVKLQVGSKYMLLYSVTVEGGGGIVLCFSKMRLKEISHVLAMASSILK